MSPKCARKPFGAEMWQPMLANRRVSHVFSLRFALGFALRAFHKVLVAFRCCFCIQGFQCPISTHALPEPKLKLAVIKKGTPAYARILHHAGHGPHCAWLRKKKTRRRSQVETPDVVSRCLAWGLERAAWKASQQPLWARVLVPASLALSGLPAVP